MTALGRDGDGVTLSTEKTAGATKEFFVIKASPVAEYRRRARPLAERAAPYSEGPARGAPETRGAAVLPRPLCIPANTVRKSVIWCGDKRQGNSSESKDLRVIIAKGV